MTAASTSSVRVLVVDDSATTRRMIRKTLEEDPEIEVIGEAVDGIEAVAMTTGLKPDVVTLDVDMPNLDGLGALKQIIQRHPRLPVIMFSSLTEQGAAQTLDALAAGAADYVTKPAGARNREESVESIRAHLIPKIKALAGLRRLTSRRSHSPAPQVPSTPQAAPAAPVALRASTGALSTRLPEAVVVACSTGGPDALTEVVEQLPPLPVPMLVVQHMPPVFTTLFAQRLAAVAAGPAVEVTDGQLLEPGGIYVAPGDYHLTLARDTDGRVRCVLSQDEKENYVRPAADVLFRSAADIWGSDVLAVVLTGMGLDGREGARAVVDAGGTVMIQDEESSVVWGMPGAVAGAGLAHYELPLPQIPDALTRCVTGGRAALEGPR